MPDIKMLGEIIMEFNQFAYHHKVKTYSLKELDQELVSLQEEAIRIHDEICIISEDLDACDEGAITYPPRIQSMMENKFEDYQIAYDTIDEKQKMLGFVIKKFKKSICP